MKWRMAGSLSAEVEGQRASLVPESSRNHEWMLDAVYVCVCVVDSVSKHRMVYSLVNKHLGSS